MEKNVKNELISKLNENLEKINIQIEMLNSSNSLEKYNSVVMFENGLSINIDENKKPYIDNGIFAAQFTHDFAKSIAESIYNGNNEKPIIVTPLEFYEKRKEMNESLIELLK